MTDKIEDQISLFAWWGKDTGQAINDLKALRFHDCEKSANEEISWIALRTLSNVRPEAEKLYDELSKSDRVQLIRKTVNEMLNKHLYNLTHTVHRLLDSRSDKELLKPEYGNRNSVFKTADNALDTHRAIRDYSYLDLYGTVDTDIPLSNKQIDRLNSLLLKKGGEHNYNIFKTLKKSDWIKEA